MLLRVSETGHTCLGRKQMDGGLKPVELRRSVGDRFVDDNDSLSEVKNYLIRTKLLLFLIVVIFRRRFRFCGLIIVRIFR